MWAVRGVESLHYLNDLNDVFDSNLRGKSPYNPQMIEIAHIRWATDTAISSLDLCTASLGREYINSQPARELDHRGLDPIKNPQIYTKLPRLARSWIDGVISDQRYLEIHSFRNPLTHSRLFRKFYLPYKPAKFAVEGSGKLMSSARELVRNSKNLATDQVIVFLKVLDSL